MSTDTPSLPFAAFPLSQVGHDLSLVGAVWNGGGQSWLCLFPENLGSILDPISGLVMSAEDWGKLIRQSPRICFQLAASATRCGAEHRSRRGCNPAITAAYRTA